MNIPCFVLLSLIGIIYNVSAVTIYGLTTAPNAHWAVVSVNMSTGAFTFIATEDDDTAGLFPAISCFDQSSQTFYYVTDKAINAVDVLKRRELPKAKYETPQVTSLTWDNITSQLLLAMIPAYNKSFFLYAYPPATAKGHHHEPKILANLSAEGITWADFQTLDPVHNIFYSIFIYNYSYLEPLMHSFSLDDPSTVIVAPFPCFSKKVRYMTYDAIQGKLVGVVSNSSSGDQYFYTFVIEADGSCTLSMNLPGMVDVSAATYDPITATFYIGYVNLDSLGVYIFETKTSQITMVPGCSNVLYDIEVAY